MESWVNDILNNNNLTAEEIVEKLRKATEEKELVEKDIADKNLSSKYIESDRNRLAEVCKNQYDRNVWYSLSEKSRRDLELAYFYSEFTKMIDDDESTPIIKLTKTVENEIRDKLFVEFVNNVLDDRPDETYRMDRKIEEIIDEYINNDETDLGISLAQMLYTINESAKNNVEKKFAYAFRLYEFIKKGNWSFTNFYSAKSKRFYIAYSDEYRNPSAHSYVYDDKQTEKCKTETREILTWFINSRAQ